MEFQITPERIFALDGDGTVLAEVTFPIGKDGVSNIDHTFVHPSLRGKGVATELLTQAAELLRRENRKTRLTCSYAVTWFEQHPEYGDLLIK